MCGTDGLLSPPFQPEYEGEGRILIMNRPPETTGSRSYQKMGIGYTHINSRETVGGSAGKPYCQIAVRFIYRGAPGLGIRGGRGQADGLKQLPYGGIGSDSAEEFAEWFTAVRLDDTPHHPFGKTHFRSGVAGRGND